ncbi:MAG: hypothetical protein NW208_11980 [Bryobacter sp.]|nr:hypothetical protein [Bryobacter sp.]
MRLLASFFLVFCALPGASPALSPWQRILRAYGLPPEDWARVEHLVGHSSLTQSLGIGLGKQTVEVRQIRDITRPELPLIWEKPEKVVAAVLSPEWTVFARERWQGAPVLAGRRVGEKVLLWTATAIGERGYERYPFLPQAMARLGVVAPARAANLTVFFDASHRLRVDVPYLVKRWRRAGISSIHVTSWQFDGASPDKSRWLSRLIEESHAQGIAVYAWLELPHVSGVFWEQHPECREKTATGADAELDWRQLVNLVNPACADLAAQSILALLRSYDWDGANLGELYFESLEGFANRSRFTPFSADAQQYFREKLQADPAEAFAESSPLRPAFVEARAELAARLQMEWLARLDQLQKERPDFDIMLTHIDDRLDTRMREALGADSARLLAATEKAGTAEAGTTFPTFLIEDPATVWHLGPERYREIRARYEGLTAQPERLAIDLNIVERYQEVYPTKQQTGGELLQLVHEAAQNFDQVALYFEASLQNEDLPLLAGAAARLKAKQGEEWELGGQAWVAVEGPQRVDGLEWPFARKGELLLTAGKHTVRAGSGTTLAVEPRNLVLQSVQQTEQGWSAVYRASTQAWLISSSPFRIRLREKEIAANQNGRGEWVVRLPRAKAGEFELLAGPSEPLPAELPLTQARN